MLEKSLITVADVMTKDVVSVRPETSLLQAVKLMAQRHVSGLPVVDQERRPIGILTEGDLLRWHGDFSEKQDWWLTHLADGHELAPSFLDLMRSERQRVKTLMNHEPICVPPDLPASDVARLFYEKHIKHAPVVEDGKLIGMISRADLLQALANELSTPGG